MGRPGRLSCGGAASNNFCGWIHESHANFMPHQLTEYRGDVHCSEMLDNAPHLCLGSTRDRYCNWQFMEFLKDKYCYQAVNDIWLAATTSNDPFTNIASTRGWNTGQLNDFFGEWAMHNVTCDDQNPPPTSGGNQSATYRSKYGAITDTSKVERRLRLTRLDPLDEQGQRGVLRICRRDDQQQLRHARRDRCSAVRVAAVERVFRPRNSFSCDRVVNAMVANVRVRAN